MGRMELEGTEDSSCYGISGSCQIRDPSASTLMPHPGRALCTCCLAVPPRAANLFIALQSPDHTDSCSAAILILYRAERSWILVAIETGSPNYKEFDSLDVKAVTLLSLGLKE